MINTVSMALSVKGETPNRLPPYPRCGWVLIGVCATTRPTKDSIRSLPTQLDNAILEFWLAKNSEECII